VRLPRAFARHTSPFLILKRGKTLDNFVVKSYGLPRKGKPAGAVEVLYGEKKLPFRKLPRATRDKPMMRFIKVKLPGPGSVPVTKGDRKTVKKLHSLHPTEYYSAMSEPERDLPVRAAMQSMKQKLNVVWDLLSASLSEMRLGFRVTAASSLHRVKHCLHVKDKWTIYDHLLSRFVQWAIDQIATAKRLLVIFGLSAQDIRLASPRDKQKDRRSFGAQLVID